MIMEDLMFSSRYNLKMMNIDEQPKICVVIRKRPLNKKEIQRN